MPVLPRQESSTESAAFPSSAGDPTALDPDQWLTGKQFVTLGVVSLFLMIGPFLIWQIWATINTWGWWKPATPINSHHHRHYVRTWHGWVTAEHYRQGVVQRKTARKKLHQKLAWKTSTADYSWVFWDPEGARRQAYEESKKPLAKWLPAWARSWEFGSVAWRKGDEMLKVQDPEQGRSHTEPTHLSPATTGPVPTEASSNVRHGSCQSTSGQLDGLQDRATSTTFRALMSGALTGDSEGQHAGTVRRRIFRRASPAWMMDSVEIEIVTAQQLFNTQHPEYTLTQITDMGTDTTAGIHWPRRNGPGQDSDLAAIHRVRSMPAMLPMNTDHNLVRAPSLPILDETQLQQSRTLYRARSIEGPSAPNSSEDIPTPRGFTPTAGELAVRFGNTQTFSSDPSFAQKLNRSLQTWAKPLLLNPFASTGPENCGTAGRRGSPAMGWMAVGAKVDGYLEDMRGYEDGSELCYAGSESTSSVDTWVPFPKPGVVSNEKSLAQHADGGLKQKWSRKSSVSNPKRAVCGYGEHANTSEPTSVPRWYEKYRQISGSGASTEKHIIEHVAKPKPDRAVHASPLGLPTTPSPKRSVSFILPTNRGYFPTMLDGRHSVEAHSPRRRLSLPEKCFLDSLHRKLNWLSFELAPGFRGPEDNPAESWHAPLQSHGRLSGNVVSRATETQKRMLTRSGALRTEGKDSSAAPQRLDIPEINDWRTAVNSFRWLSGTEDLLHSIIHYEGDSIEPREEDIDTAAWILRRPPQGFEPTDAGMNSYYTGVKGYSEKMWEWEVVRRPYVLERMVRKHEGKHHDGVGGAVIRRVGKVFGLIMDKEDVKGKGKGKAPDRDGGGRGVTDGFRCVEMDAAVEGRDAPSTVAPTQGPRGGQWDAEAYERGSMRDYRLSGSES
ncbi:hypothetical protein MMC16_003790 [Acarospora aff. strigata]|nr:hypothetical protein [Acarospora aff. strigata]